MTTWERLRVDAVCGGCGAALPAGAPALVITVPGVSRRLVRCVGCVEADAVLAAVASDAPDEDWKARQSGER